MSELLYLLLAVVSIALSIEAYFVGFRRGRDQGWLDRQDELWREEKQRRDAAGHFRSTKLIIRQL